MIVVINNIIIIVMDDNYVGSYISVIMIYYLTVGLRLSNYKFIQHFNDKIIFVIIFMTCGMTYHIVNSIIGMTFCLYSFTLFWPVIAKGREVVV